MLVEAGAEVDLEDDICVCMETEGVAIVHLLQASNCAEKSFSACCSMDFHLYIWQL